MKRKNQTRIGIVPVIVVVCLLALGAWGPLAALAAPPALPPRPTPPTPTPATPTPAPLSETTSRPEPPPGGYIVLRAPSAPANLWTVVQWQDNAGGWHTVEGWQGALDAGAQKVWWVAEKDFGAGPFRWALYRGQRGRLLAAGKPFYLPRAANQTVTVFP